MRQFSLPVLFVFAAVASIPDSLSGANLETPAAVSPGAASELSRIRSLCPTFSWGGVEGAESYEIVVHRLVAPGGAPIDESSMPQVGSLEPSIAPVLSWKILGAARSFTPDVEGCLEPGESYAWMLRAWRGGVASPWSEPALLRVASDRPADGFGGERVGGRAARPDNDVGDDLRDDASERAAQDEEAERKRIDAAIAEVRLNSGVSMQASEWAATRLGAESNAPSPGTASLTVSRQLHLGKQSSIFKDGALFLWDEIAPYNGQDLGSTALGRGALASNDSSSNGPFGRSNTAVGFRSLAANTGGYENTAVGAAALESNDIGNRNVAVGRRSLERNDRGSFNVAVGTEAMVNNETGAANVGVGTLSLFRNTEGQENVALGWSSLFNNVTGRNNVAIGSYAGLTTTGSDNILIGSRGKSAESNVLRIGDGTGTERSKIDRAFISGINGRPVEGAPVMVTNAGQLGTPGCGGYVPAPFCPAGNGSDGPRCDQVAPGSFCETDGECSLDGALDNCGGADWYFRTN